MALCWH